MIGPAVRQHGLDQLELGDGLAELLALHGVGQTVGDQPFRHADAEGGNVQPAAIQNLHRRPETLAFPAAENGGSRDAAVFEDHVAGVRAGLPHLLVRLAK